VSRHVLDLLLRNPEYLESHPEYWCALSAAMLLDKFGRLDMPGLVFINNYWTGYKVLFETLGVRDPTTTLQGLPPPNKTFVVYGRELPSTGDLEVKHTNRFKWALQRRYRQSRDLSWTRVDYGERGVFSAHSGTMINRAADVISREIEAKYGFTYIETMVEKICSLSEETTGAPANP